MPSLFETYELTAALNVWDRVAGISRYAYENDLILAVKPDIAQTVPSPGSGIDTNMETLFKARPDLVITWSFKPEDGALYGRQGAHGHLRLPGKYCGTL